MNSENPTKWRFIWEAQSHTPTLKLIVFNTDSRPSTDCSNLCVHLKLSQCHVLLSWTVEEAGEKVSLKVPIPNVLIDSEIPVSFRALEDHIEVKVVLLLPVDHPILSSFDSMLDLGDATDLGGCPDGLSPLNMNSDLKSLSSTEGVNFYCRQCSAKLTRSAIRNFKVMPSENWREVADNWFGGCCCSFGGVGEKLANTFADAYGCGKGLCLLSSPAVTLFKDDIMGCEFSSNSDAAKLCEPEPLPSNTGETPGTFHASKKDEHQNGQVRPSLINSGNDGKIPIHEDLPAKYQSSVGSPGFCGSTCHACDFASESDTPDGDGPSSMHNEATRATKFPEHQKSFLNGFLGDAFMVGSYNRSVCIEWEEFLCPQCSSLLGAYPVSTSDIPVDNGIRLFKCFLATNLPACGPGDIFRRYSLEKMFTNKLVENATDELSYRTLVKDLVTKSPMLQIVLLNPNSWSCSGFCLDTQIPDESISKLDLRPVIKVSFSSYSTSTESTARLSDEVFVMKPLVLELIKTLEDSKHKLPPSFIQVENMSLSTLFR